MKTIVKFAAAAALMLVSTSAMAQYTPEAGTITTEVQFNPFGQDKNHFSLDGLKVRYFLNENHAIRVNLGFDINNDNDIQKDVINTKYNNDVTKYQISNVETETNTNNTSFKIAAGYEYHFVNTGRLNVYIGGELGYKGDFWSKDITETTNYNDYSHNPVASGTYYSIVEKKRTITEKTEYTDGDGLGNRTNHSIFLQAFTGVDFYIYKGLYVGTELGIRFNSTNYVNSTYEVTYDYNEDVITRYTAGTGSVPATAIGKTVNTKENWTFTSENQRKTGKKIVTDTNPAPGTPATVPTDINEHDLNTTGIVPASERTRTTARLQVYIEPCLRLGWKF